MAKTRIWIILFTIVGVISFSDRANALTIIGTATYENSSYNLIYEESQDLVWLDYTKFSNPWPNQLSWASGLGNQIQIFLDPSYTVTWVDQQWRLPSAGLTPTSGFNHTSSEMGNLYYNSLGNLDFLQGGSLTNVGPFTNLEGAWGQYYTGTEKVDTYGNTYAWFFYFGGQYPGYQYEAVKNVDYKYALAVRSAQVTGGPTQVPEPATMLLLGLGLVGLAGVRRKFKN